MGSWRWCPYTRTRSIKLSFLLIVRSETITVAANLKGNDEGLVP